jgi:hypothetical protein
MSSLPARPGRWLAMRSWGVVEVMHEHAITTTVTLRR